MSTPGAGKSGNSVFDQSAGALTGAGTAFQKAAKLYGTPTLGNAATAANPAAISSGIASYMNPYTDTVINNTAKDIQNLAAVQHNQTGADASSVGAFGGSRMGIVDALTNSEAQKNIGDVSANLRMSGYNTAAGLSAQDIANQIANRQFNAGQTNQFALGKSADQIARAGGIASVGQGAEGLGTTGFTIGQQIQDTQQQQGGLQQALAQAIMGGAGNQFATKMGQPKDMLSMIIQSLGLNPLTTATKTTGTSTPGLFDWMSLIGQTAGAIYGGS